ncbi:hypothetical protein H1C71_039875, partial [Ictidomys tridecemlineatus]
MKGLGRGSAAEHPQAPSLVPEKKLNARRHDSKTTQCETPVRSESPQMPRTSHCPTSCHHAPHVHAHTFPTPGWLTAPGPGPPLAFPCKPPWNLHSRGAHGAEAQAPHPHG